MTGNRKLRVVLQERDKRMLSDLATLRMIDRNQAKLIGGFTSLSRANARLTALLRAGYLERSYFGTIKGGQKSLYALSKRGAAEVGAPHRKLKRAPGQVIGADGFTPHQLRITNILVALGYMPASVEAKFVRWITFTEPIAPAIPIIPDAYVELLASNRLVPLFIEVDLGTESLKILEQKAKSYLQLAVSGEFQKRFGHSQFRVLVATASESWLQNIRAIIAKLTDKIFWFATFSSISREGIWAPVWQRPTGDQKQTLI